MGLSRKTIGPYRLLSVIGHGGMGVVYRAEHVRTGASVALKTVRLSRSGMLRGIRREIRALAALDHPGIVRIVDHGVVEGMPWYAMDFVVGVPLKAWAFGHTDTPSGSDVSDDAAVDEPPPAGDPSRLETLTVRAAELFKIPPDLGRRLELVVLLCDTLAFLHGHGFVHCDLKPANVIVGPDDRPILVDFGLVSRFVGQGNRDELSLRGAGVGTVGYMSPEQLKGAAFDARADLYALGCILFELITGERPYDGRNALEIAGRHIYADVPRVRDRRPGIPPQLDDLVARLMEKDPRRRMGYAVDVGATLRRLGIGRDRPGETPPPAYVYRAPLTGRAGAIQQLEDQLGWAQRGRGRCVLVHGPSGIGKTRLMLEFAALAGRRRVRTYSGTASPDYSDSFATLFEPCRQLVERALDGETELLARLSAEPPELLPEVFPFLRGLFGHTSMASPASRSPGAARRRLCTELAALFRLYTEDQTTVLFLDRLEHGDPMTMEWLVTVVETGWLARMGLLIVGAYRDEEMTEWLERLAAQEAVVDLRLEPLTEGDTALMIADMLALARPPEAFARSLLSRAQGNPLYIAEYTRAAVESNLLWRDARGRWRLADHVSQEDIAREISRLPTSRTLRELLAHRLQALSVPARRVCSIAALLGHPTDLQTLRALAGLGELAFDRAMAELHGGRILEMDDRDQVIVSQPDLRELAAQRIPPALVPLLHRRAAAALGRTGRDDLEALTRQGRHYLAAGQRREAIGAFRRAASVAIARGQIERAVRQLHQALDLAAGNVALGCELRRQLAMDLLVPLGRLDEALDACAENQGAADDLEAHGLLAQALVDRSAVERTLGRLADAEVHLRRAIDLARARDDAPLIGRALTRLAMLDVDHGLTDTAREVLDMARGSLEARRPDRRTRARFLHVAARAALADGDLLEAAEKIRAAKKLVRRTGDRLLYVDIGRTRIDILLALGELGRARSLAERLVGGLGQLSYPFPRAASSVHLARTLRLAGELDRLDEMLDAALESLDAMGARLDWLACCLERGAVALALGRSARTDLDRAADTLDLLHLGRKGPLGRSLDGLERAQKALSMGAGDELFRGQLPDDLPARLRPGT